MPNISRKLFDAIYVSLAATKNGSLPTEDSAQENQLN
jgi:predicted nucleic acid-binding protein